MNEQELFLKDLKADTSKDVFEMPFNAEPEKEGVETEQENADETSVNPEPKNRRERRLIEKLESERRSAIEMAERMAALAEAKSVSEEADYLKKIERIYGTDSPEAQMATSLLKEAIVGARDDAENRAYERMRAERDREVAAEEEATEQLDSMLDEIEDAYGVTLNSTQTSAYFTLMERMSPKDKNGNIIEYADPHAVFEIFQERSKPQTDNRARDLASRSMTRSGTASNSKAIEDANLAILRENGII